MSEPTPEAHLPSPEIIESYGLGGFRFGGMSHRGSLLCLPDGMWGWGVTDASQITEGTLERVFAQAANIDMLLIGQGREMRPIAESLRWRLRDVGISADVMSTGQALRTWNILLSERRRVAATLIAVD